MTKNTFLAGVAAATMALFTACADDTPGGGSGQGGAPLALGGKATPLAAAPSLDWI